MNIIAYILFILQIISLMGMKYPIIFLFENFFFMNGVPGFCTLLGYFTPTYLGFFLLGKHKKRMAKKHVAFYCDTCRDVVGEPSGKQCTCLNCRRPRRELRVLRSEWDSLSAAEKAYYVNMR